MPTARPLAAARRAEPNAPTRFAALPRDATSLRLPPKPRLTALDPSLWWLHTLRRTVWRWQRRTAPRATAALVWC